MFRKLSVSAVALSLLAAPAMAVDATDTVTLNATVGDYIAITSTSDSTIGDLDISEGSGVGANNNATNSSLGEKALFEVTANVDYSITLDWETWQDAGITLPPPPVNQTYEQANYRNASETCSIGGAVSFDPDPAPSSQNDAKRSSGGVTPFDVPGTFNPGVVTYGISTEASPNITNCPGGVAAPGTYSLDVEITVSAS